MASITVSTSAQLKTALSSAHAGDVILMTSGVYAGLNLQNYHFSTPVTVESADANHPATLLDLTLRSSSGLNFSNLELNASHAAADWPFRVYSSTNINFSHLNVHGSLDSNPQNDFSGLLISGSSNVVVSHSNFEQLKTAVAFLNDDHLEVSGNSFHDLALDGVHGGGSSYVTINGNSFTDFYVATGGHPDAIQFWTTNTTASAHDIMVSGNVIVRGSGAPMQGIFITDQVGTLPYKNLTISGNMLVGTRYHGIMVGHGSNVAITGNVVAGLPDMLSWIRLEHVNGGTVTTNSAGELTQVSDLNIAVTDFSTLLLSSAQSEQLLEQWLSSHATVAAVYDGGSTGLQSGSTVSATTSTTTVSYNQTLNGTASDDVLIGGSGNDHLDGEAGADKMSGGTGNDVYYVDNVGDVVTENSGAGSDTVISKISYKLGANVESLVLSGSSNIDGIGNAANNLITGNAGANVIEGGSGNDSLVGGAGADKIIGGAGKDMMTGGSGCDLFVFHNGDFGSDRITDFKQGEDRIYLSGVDANTLMAGDQNFHFVGSNAFSGHAGELHYQEISGSTYVSGDTNGDGIADFTIHVDGLHVLTSSDFFL